MSQVAGYFVVLSSSRYVSFDTRISEKFAEPVPEFLHSRYVPLICFIIKKPGIITHVGFCKRGVAAGTDLRRLDIFDLSRLKTALSAEEIADATPKRVRNYIVSKIKKGGLIAPKSFEAFISAFLEKAKELIPILNKYSIDRRLRIEKLSKSIRKSLAEQKEAVLTALNIAGINKTDVQGWDYSEIEGPISFLDGIETIKLREDSMIINDLVNFPGFDLIKKTKYSASLFQNKNTRLTVLLANRLPLEELLGTDLIYYNEDFQCFVMVQYKVMEKENDKFLFRIPNDQLRDEIFRMESMIATIKTLTNSEEINDFRMSNNPFFIKICPRIEFDPDNVGLSSGMYIPLEYLKLLQIDQSIKGARGGRSISYENVGRYLDNTAFKYIIEGGWIGTNTKQSAVLRAVIRNTLENGRSVVLAIKKRILQEEFNLDDCDLEELFVIENSDGE